VNWREGLREVGSVIALFFIGVFLMPVLLLFLLIFFGGASRNKCGDCGATNSYKSSQCWHCKAPLTPSYNR
jgi:predicted amidophosphoribosyltransferase